MNPRIDDAARSLARGAALAAALALVPAAVAAATTLRLAGRGGELSGSSTLTVRGLGRDRSPLSAALRIAPEALSADSGHGFRLSGTYAQGGRGGRALAVAHDQGSTSSLLSALATRTASLYARRRGAETAFGVTVLTRRTVAKADRKGARITLVDAVRFTATSPALGRTFRGTYRSKVRGALGDTPLPACAAPDDPVALALNGLGVSTCPSPRLDDEGDALPDDFTPLGPTRAFDTAELLFVGPDATFPEGTTDTVGIFELTPEAPLPGEPVRSYRPDLLYAPAGGDRDWAVDDGVAPQTRRAAAAADVDGDGLEEIVAVHLRGNDLTFRTVDDAKADFAPREVVVAVQAGVRDVSARGGDFDGDGRSEVAVALALDDAVRLLVFAHDGTRYRLDLTRTLASRRAGSTLFTALDAGNLDNDPSDELVLLVNERVGLGNNPEGGVAHFVALDDARSTFAELGAGLVRADEGPGVHTAVVADVSLGDVDGDGREEVVFGGLTNYAEAVSGNTCKPTGHLVLALDDARHGLAPLAATHFDYVFAGCEDNGADVWLLRYLDVSTPDLDGDGAAEVQANQFVWDDLRNASPWTALPGIPDDRFFRAGTGSQLLDRSTAAVAAADVTGDGREDVVLFHQNSDHEISVWSDDQIRGFGEVTGTGGGLPIPVQFTGFQYPTSPIIVPANVAPDGPVLKYGAATHRFVFTEPIVIAALAAPPCGTGLGQATDACRTSYGSSQTSSGGVDSTITVSAGVTLGASVEFLGAGVEVTGSITRAASFSAAQSYELERSIVFTTGPLEDAVVFSTLPVDQYTYTVQSHPIAALVGEQVVVNVPRTPITLIAERSFYNRTVSEGSVKVDESVFRHTIGDPRSYPTRAEKDALIEPVGECCLGPLEEHLDEEFAGKLLGGGFASDLATVGQGGSDTAVTLRFAQTNEYRAGREIAYALEMNVTGGGVLVGGSVGGSESTGIGWGNTSATTYSGTVGSLSADAFAAGRYSFGIFTYVHGAGDYGRPQFEVVHYWVE
jgi:hypothetical protein